ncbi:LysM domain-containing protein [Desulfonispora thiosulfatigenes DSM 11270]|uniref:LysM domain-containing protein n=1 Tax=Desulfonispora thiosulfatigenes DSM 11270 TaxID=656914 RepID=A0A1W1V7W8_DESTI|nr:LysM peptidoglycan-binding domain-containing protein [Desulfonispora thiosulfatigenes]SMB89084.1 LysM domain-containing protein [Desulfonispora thiosulfatigenes DSM 11270]
MQKYTVQSGDTLNSIAEKYNVTLDQLLQANPNIKDPDNIYVGLVVMIPAPEEKPPAFCPTLRMGNRGAAVRRLQIALRYSGFYYGPITGYFGSMTDDAVRRLQQARGLPVTGVVNVATWKALGVNCGYVPIPPMPPTPVFNYLVQPGDTLYSISLRFNVPIQSILMVNPEIINPNFISPGQIIRIPAR